MTAPQATEELVAPPTTEPGRLHRPARAVVALVELLAAGLAVVGAFWAWPRGFATISTVVGDGTTLESERVLGNWLAAAIAFGTIAAVLVLDAVRQLLLAVRIRPRRGRRRGAVPAAARANGEPNGETNGKASAADAERNTDVNAGPAVVAEPGAKPEPVPGPGAEGDGDR